MPLSSDWKVEAARFSETVTHINNLCVCVCEKYQNVARAKCI
jgi:hypothetical protein